MTATTTEVPAPPQAIRAAGQQLNCFVCGRPSNATECLSCVITEEIAAKRRADQ